MIDDVSRSEIRKTTSHNSTNHDTPFLQTDYSGRSIVFAARELVV